MLRSPKGGFGEKEAKLDPSRAFDIPRDVIPLLPWAALLMPDPPFHEDFVSLISKDHFFLNIKYFF